MVRDFQESQLYFYEAGPADAESERRGAEAGFRGKVYMVMFQSKANLRSSFALLSASYYLCGRVEFL